jgi:hypothetical protein
MSVMPRPIVKRRRFKKNRRTKPKIKIKKKNRGKFTAWAKRHGFKSVSAAASHVLKNKGRYSSGVVKMANFARNASKWKK